MIYASVCSGIEAPSVAWKTLPNWKAAWFSEIEPFPCAVLNHHYPEVPNLGDMTRLYEQEVFRDTNIDVLVGGTPCQSFSVAGLRKGLADPRGNLALVFLSLVDRVRPSWVVWENVPGLLSDKDNAFVVFLDALEELGYIADVDILDAQYFGVPQRRRRIFVCAQSRESLMNARTISSALTISQCLAEILLLILIVLKNRSATELPDLGFDAGKPSLSLQRRIKLFSMEKEGAAQILHENLAVIHRLYEQEQKKSESKTGRNGRGGIRISEDTRFPESIGGMESWREGFLNIESSWNNILEGVLQIANECTTSTPTKEIIESKIYTCAQLLMRIAAPIIQSMDYSPPFWSAVSSISITMKEFTNYARQASSDLFTGMEWVHNWSDFLGKAERASISFSDLRARNFTREIFPITKSLSGDTPPGRKEGERIAPCLSQSLKSSGGIGMSNQELFSQGEAGLHWQEDVAATLRSGGNGGIPSSREEHPGDNRMTICMAHGQGNAEIRSDGSPSLTCNHEAPIVIRTAQTSANGHGIAENVAHTLDGAQGQTVLRQTLSEIQKMGQSFKGERQSTHARSIVRRLTPVECEFLMGFPRDYTNIPWRGKPHSPDGPRYKALGNSMAVPVISWIGKRIESVEAICGKKS